MPIAARLSREFYQRLGDEVTNELVDWFNQIDMHYQSTLQQLNEANAGRFEARLDRGLAEVRAEMRVEFAKVNARIQGLAEQTNARIDALAEQTAAQIHALAEQTATQIHALAGQTSTRIDGLAQQMATKTDLANLRQELIERMDEKMAMQLRWMIGLMIPTWLGVMGLWLRR